VGIVRSWLDAELVAFRILHHGDVVIALDHRGAQGDEALDLLAHARKRAKVNVDPVGCAFRSATTPEPDVRAAPAGRLDKGTFAGGFLVHVGHERGGPEASDAKGILAVEGQVLDERRHAPPPVTTSVHDL